MESEAEKHLSSLSKEDQMRFHFLYHFTGYLLFIAERTLKEHLLKIVERKIGWSRVLEIGLPFMLMPMSIASAETEPLLNLIPNSKYREKHFKSLVDLSYLQKENTLKKPYYPKRGYTYPDISLDPYTAFQQMIVFLLSEASLEVEDRIPNRDSAVFVAFKQIIAFTYRTFKKLFDENADNLSKRTFAELSRASKGIEGVVLLFEITSKIRDNPEAFKNSQNDYIKWKKQNNSLEPTP